MAASIPEGARRISVNLTAPGQADLDFVMATAGIDITHAVLRGLSLLAKTVRLEAEGGKTVLVQPDGQAVRVVFL